MLMPLRSVEQAAGMFRLEKDCGSGRLQKRSRCQAKLRGERLDLHRHAHRQSEELAQTQHRFVAILRKWRN